MFCENRVHRNNSTRRYEKKIVETTISTTFLIIWRNNDSSWEFEFDQPTIEASKTLLNSYERETRNEADGA